VGIRQIEGFGRRKANRFFRQRLIRFLSSQKGYRPKAIIARIPRGTFRRSSLAVKHVMRENVLNPPEEQHWTKLNSSWSSDRLNRFSISPMYFSGRYSSLNVRSAKILNTASYSSRTLGCVDRQSRVTSTVRSHVRKDCSFCHFERTQVRSLQHLDKQKSP